VADALHAHAADAVTLVCDSWLAVADARHTHAADNVVLGGVDPDIQALPLRTSVDPARRRIHADPAGARRYTDAAITRIYRDAS
jgi:hypothetical protein